MGPAAILSYLSGALVYALLASAVVMAVLRLCGSRHAGRKVAVLCLAAFFPVFLGLSPFPDPGALDCTDGGKRPILRPFAFLDAYLVFWEQGRPLAQWLRSLSILSPIMNVVFFSFAGMALARLTGRWRIALVFACALTLVIELAQLSALFGLYPCRYRHFEVDDLILNVTGVLLGFALWRGLVRRVRPA